MFFGKISRLHGLPLGLLLLLLLPSRGDALKPRSTAASEGSLEATILLPKSWSKTLSLAEGQKIEVTAGIPKPSALPPHARVGIRWSLLAPVVGQPTQAEIELRASSKLEIEALPTANWQKTLHALDPDVHLVYRAPLKGEYQVEVVPVLEGPTPFEGTRWRETGSAPSVAVFPRRTPWPRAFTAPVMVSIRQFNLGEGSSTPPLEVETEPNDTPEMAQPLTLPLGEGIQRLLISAGGDDIEYFDNGKVGNSGDDWFRFTYEGQEPRLLTCSLAIPDQTLAARLRLYALDANDKTTSQQLLSKSGLSGSLLPIVEYLEGRNENERVHQQNEGHRSEINRLLKPGQTYFLRAEANAPGYEIELRMLRPAPYEDPTMAVRQALYDHLGQVDAWLANRPRGASVERRIRDAGNLMGTHCMSCHTQSGVWGPAVAVENGYKPENLQQIRRLINIMYESMRPTNYLKEAANNTSLAPLDVGDGPAGTRVAGHNVCTAERVWPASKLHSMQAIRAANHVLQTADPSGINAAGPGSNVGQSVVYNYAGEILRTAWDRTGHPRYFAALEEKAEKMLAVQPRYSDDLSHRIEFFRRFFPRDYLNHNRKAREAQLALPPPPLAPMPAPTPATGKPADATPKPAEFPAYALLDSEAAQKLLTRIEEQLVKDEARLRAVQNPDGTWGFDPGKLAENGKSWKTDGQYDPAPTALGLIALQALGYGKDDPAISRGVKALLSKQDPYGRWNKTAQTGFVTTAYALHALSRLYPVAPEKPTRATFEAQPQESLRARIARVRGLSHSGESGFADLMIQAVQDSSPWVRYWGVMGLGGIHGAKGTEALVKALGDRVKMVRDAAAWAMEQALLDDAGFAGAFEAFGRGDDLTRESIVKALVIRADAVMSQPSFSKARLTQLLGKALNDDPHPGVRAWAAKAAWQWWVWNPPLREPIQQAWTRKLLSPESNALVENCFRYQSHALFIANGHKANASEEHQYAELSLLFKRLELRLDDATLSDAVKDRLARRLVAVAGTFFNTTGGDGGPGQMGYVTPGSSNLFGKAAFRYFQQAEAAKNLPRLRLILEGAAGIPFSPLQDRLIDYSASGPEELRTLAAAAVSDPSTVTLPGTQELVQPLVDQIMRGAQDYDRRQTLAQPVLKLFSRARWSIPKTTEQQQLLYSFLVPKYVKEPDPQSTAGIRAAAERAIQPMGQLDADWYIADRMGRMLAANPDLHTETLLSRIPTTVKNPLEAHFWLPSVSWVFDFGEPVPEIGGAQSSSALPSAVTGARERMLTIYLQMLATDTVGLSRNAAAGLASLTALRRQPAVIEEMRQLLKSEKNDRVRQAAENVLRTEQQRWLADLQETVKVEPSAASLRQGPEAKLSPEFIASFQYFNDYVSAELNRPQRMDEMACMSCHGVPGRVPSMQLEPPDSTGYFSTAKLLKNYVTLQQRINLPSIEQSKLLRKPLNVQTGKEDGHQGGRRYLPADRGYQIIRRWVLDQPRVQMSLNPNGSQQAGR